MSQYQYILSNEYQVDWPRLSKMNYGRLMRLTVRTCTCTLLQLVPLPGLTYKPVHVRTYVSVPIRICTYLCMYVPTCTNTPVPLLVSEFEPLLVPQLVPVPLPCVFNLCLACTCPCTLSPLSYSVGLLFLQVCRPHVMLLLDFLSMWGRNIKKPRRRSPRL